MTRREWGFRIVDTGLNYYYSLLALAPDLKPVMVCNLLK